MQPETPDEAERPETLDSESTRPPGQPESDAAETAAIEEHEPRPVSAALIYLLAIVAGVAVDYFFPLALLPFWVGIGLGIAVLAAGGVLYGAAVGALVQGGGSTDPAKPSQALVTDGPYRFSRNPTYIAYAIFAAGVALLLNSGWALGLAAAALIAVQSATVEPEERELEAQFGDEYREYKQRVRPWI